MLIFLIGFMGSGKSHTGRRLAAMLQYDFIDLDDRLEQKEGRSISEIFAQDGEAFFRERESFYLRSLETDQDTVVATGGGTPCQSDNLLWMRQHGLVVYLSATPELLAERLLSERAHRPLVARLEVDALLDFVRDKLSERSKYYELADVQVQQVAGLDVAELMVGRLFGRKIDR